MKSHIFTLITKSFGKLKILNLLLKGWIKINTKDSAILISTFDLSILYTKLPNKGLLKVLFDLIDFGFDRGSKKKN